MKMYCNSCDLIDTNYNTACRECYGKLEPFEPQGRSLLCRRVSAQVHAGRADVQRAGVYAAEASIVSDKDRLIYYAGREEGFRRAYMARARVVPKGSGARRSLALLARHANWERLRYLRAARGEVA
jgi:hypothetical protein